MSQDKEEVEINFLELGKKLWNNKKFIIMVSVVGTAIGLVVAFSIPKEYTSTVILTATPERTVSGGMGALASMAGINLGGGDAEIFSPELYPNVLVSTPFVKGLFNIRVIDKQQDIDTNLYNYILSKQETAWWSSIINFPSIILKKIMPSNENMTLTTDLNRSRHISKTEMEVLSTIREMYSIDTDKKTGTTVLVVHSQSPIISAFLADTLTSYLQSYVINERTKKANTDLQNTEKLYTKAKDDYYLAQEIFASFTDANMNVVQAKHKIKRDKLQNEVNLSFSIYNQMAQQVQMSKIKVQDSTPVFTIIQPAVEPIFPSKPSKKLILVLFIFLAFVGSSSWIIRKDLVQHIIKK